MERENGDDSAGRVILTNRSPIASKLLNGITGFKNGCIWKSCLLGNYKQKMRWMGMMLSQRSHVYDGALAGAIFRGRSGQWDVHVSVYGAVPRLPPIRVLGHDQLVMNSE
ncbi:6676_t:CDS:2 [Ambispora gerdemannii]|uniref:6676_t:CDS:1 n=1 Tax=Ambispora gerdemannii TaxID=144530 RepID=A0A9N9GC32_9GLOM|nr:6676_t:CDS:2 [Ambispora gerdemannii]